MKYFFNVNNTEKIVDAIIAYRKGELGDRYTAMQKLDSVWNAYFKVYAESEQIKKSIADENDFTWHPLYMWFGADDSDYEFSSRENALTEYEEWISRLTTHLDC